MILAGNDGDCGEGVFCDVCGWSDNTSAFQPHTDSSSVHTVHIMCLHFFLTVKHTKLSIEKSSLVPFCQSTGTINQKNDSFNDYISMIVFFINDIIVCGSSYIFITKQGSVSVKYKCHFLFRKMLLN